jgi:hypothetical protein
MHIIRNLKEGHVSTSVIEKLPAINHGKRKRRAFSLLLLVWQQGFPHYELLYVELKILSILFHSGFTHSLPVESIAPLGESL